MGMKMKKEGGKDGSCMTNAMNNGDGAGGGAHALPPSITLRCSPRLSVCELTCDRTWKGLSLLSPPTEPLTALTTSFSATAEESSAPDRSGAVQDNERYGKPSNMGPPNDLDFALL